MHRPVMRASWLGVFVRAVVVPAARRASSAWLGCSVIAGLAFGGTGVQPRDVTHLAQRDLAIGGVLAATWLLIYLPAARVLVRADAALYLRSLPAPRFAPLVVRGVAMIVLQLPWLVLWLAGAGLRGLAIVVGLSVPIALVAAWRPRLSARPPAWRSSLAALFAIHVRALLRRAGDALVRGGGLAILAGAVAGLFVHNNGLVGPAAATTAASVLAVVLVPAQVGPLLTIDETHRATAWLAASLGISPATRTAAVAAAIALVNLTATAIALVAFVLVAHVDACAIAAALAVALGAALGCTRALVTDSARRSAGAADSARYETARDMTRAATRTVAVAVVVAATAVCALAVMGLTGLVAYLATMLLVLLR